MSLEKLLYEAISFLIAFEMCRRFVIPMLNDYVSKYRMRIISEMHEMDILLQETTNALQSINIVYKQKKSEFDKYSINIKEKISENKNKLIKEFDFLFDKQLKQYEESLLVKKESDEMHIKTEITSMLKICVEMKLKKLNHFPKKEIAFVKEILK